VAAEPGPAASSSGVTITADEAIADVHSPIDTLVVVGGDGTYEAVADEHLVHHVARLAAGARRVTSVCSGSFVLARAGLLDGKRATTHWHYTKVLQAKHPRIRVDENVLFVDEGDVLTSAGAASGVDLCLHLVRRDHGVALSNQVARRLVAAPYRSGGQAQFVPRSVPEPLGDFFAATRHWALERLEGPLTVTELAGHARVSTRTFSRRFVEDTGYTPMQWILRARVDLARELLERTDLGVEQIADRVGLGTGANLRMHFQRVLGTSPSEYRHTFSQDG
jgi:transcriptional regulator GlxA family with amidase domain